MLAESNGSQFAVADAPKLRTACENCRQSKVKCNLSGKNVCTRCLRHGLHCQYGFANRSGKPKGSKNRATLRKLGQLQEEKLPNRGHRGGRRVRTVSEREPPVAGGYVGQMIDPIEEDVCSISDAPRIWEFPRRFTSATSMEVPICPSQLAAVDEPHYIELMNTPSTFSVGLGYPQTPITPTFFPSDPPAEGLASPSFGNGAVESAFPAAQCDCIDMQLFYMNRLNHLLAESMSLRFDHSLQMVSLTFCACRAFLQCNNCAKDSANMLLVISVLNLTLQVFEYWMPRVTAPTPRAGNGLELRYGCYQVCQEENRQIRAFLLRGLLLQCREVLSILTTTAVSIDCPELAEFGSTEEPANTQLDTEEADSDSWLSLVQTQASISDLESDLTSQVPEGQCLLPIIAGYEATVEAFLQSASLNDCICGAPNAKQDSL